MRGVEGVLSVVGVLDVSLHEVCEEEFGVGDR